MAIARTTRPSFLRILTAAALAVAAACVPAGPSPDEGPAPAGLGPPIEAGPSTPADDETAAGLLASARSALEAGDAAEARSAASRVVAQYPTSPGSSEALWILARAALEDGAPDEAAGAALRYASLQPAEARVEPLLLAGRAWMAADRPEDAVRAWLELPDDADPLVRDEALDGLRAAASALPNDALARLARGLPAERALATPVFAEWALAEYFSGTEDEARRFARRVLALGPAAPERRLAEAILRGEVEDVVGPLPVLGAVLPETGSPTLQEYGELIHEGIRVAMEAREADSRRPIQLRVLDDAGSPGSAAELIRRLEDAGALGVVGPLLQPSVESAVAARTRPTVIVSPSARRVPEAPGVYSLSAMDPAGPELLAAHALDEGYRRVVVLRPRSAGPAYEARVFTDALRAGGGTVLEEITYDSAATFFEEPLRRVAALSPDALVLPLPPGDVPVLAPQLEFFGLDTLGIQMLGTSAWATPEVLQEVDPRHTSGVVAATPRAPGADPEGRARFVQEYERLLRKSLRSPVPALGYDAASLLLEAYRRGARTPEELRRRLEEIQELPGATGTLSVRDGRVTRRHRIVRIENREIVPVDGGQGAP